MVASYETFPLLAELLAEQQRLDTPVARFSTLFDQGSHRPVAFTPQLIPLTAPGRGEQYAFEVDLDSCSGCKSCVAACHSLNGLDDNETWRDVGVLVSESRAHPFTQTITSACHHCADPACLNGCPVLAYEKDPVTGIVRHLDDQCIGCSYCVLKCPYDVPKFSERLGIVRKCDMCHGRLAAGEAPACAQACPTQAIRIITVPVAATADSPGTPGPTFLPAAPDPAYTRPTTRYISARRLPERLVAGDARQLRAQAAHWPLAIMLTLLPTAVGLGAVAAVGRAWPNLNPLAASPSLFSWLRTVDPMLGLAWAVGVAGLAASVFHLGQPLRAWRIFLGWRKSWLSREAMAFGGWFGAATVALWQPQLASAATAIGLAALACSAMIYVDTRRTFWRARQTFPRFFATAVVAALTLVAPLAAMIVYGLKLAIETRTWFDGRVSARLQRGPLRRISAVRDGLAVTALVLFVAAPGWIPLAVFLAGEFVERSLFFRAVDAPKMPGMAA